jgi:thioredoxin-dependent peroxiredoxin
MHMLLPIVFLLAGPEAAPRPAVGQAAPAFEAASTQGGQVRLADHLGKRAVVLAFFPKAFTGGCTKEMTAFRDRYAEFASAGAQVLGISMDDLETQKKFAESLKTPFPLLSDPSGTVAKAYGVAKEGYAERVTFVINKEGKVVQVIEGRDAIDPAGALGACTKPAAKPTS